jgi:hypothetical protein
VFLLTRHVVIFSMTHMHYAEVLQANAPCWTEHILTRANKFSPMNQSTNQGSCQVAEQIKDASLGRLALRNQALMIQRPEQRLPRLIIQLLLTRIYIDGSIMKLQLFSSYLRKTIKATWKIPYYGIRYTAILATDRETKA